MYNKHEHIYKYRQECHLVITISPLAFILTVVALIAKRIVQAAPYESAYNQ